MEQLLAVAPDVDRDRQRPVDSGRHHRAAEPPCVGIAEPGENQLFLLGFERGDERLLVVRHVFVPPPTGISGQFICEPPRGARGLSGRCHGR